MSFFSEVDTGFLDGFDSEAFQREVEIDALVMDLMNNLRNMDYCDANQLSPEH